MSSEHFLALTVRLLCSSAEAQAIQVTLPFSSQEQRGVLILVLEFWLHLEATKLLPSCSVWRDLRGVSTETQKHF